MARPVVDGAATRSDVSPELRLLLACARVSAPEAEEARIRDLLRAGPDWPAFLALGGRHGLLPIVYRRLQALEGAEVAPGPMQALRDRYYAMARRNLRLTARLVELLDALRAEGVPAIPLKGAILAATVYESLALREFGDLDLLVRRRDLDAARRALLGAGLEPLEHWGAGQDAVLRSVWYAYGWRDGRTGELVELHWRLAPRFFAVGLDTAALIATAEEAEMHGRRVSTLPPEELLLALAVHGTKEEPDGWSRLKWVRDLCEVARARPELEWDHLLDLAARAGCGRMLAVGLLLASDLLAAPVPGHAKERLEADAVARRLATRASARLLGDPPPTTRLGRLRFELAVRERWRDRARTVLRRAFLPDTKDLGLVRLPRPLAPLYFPLRAARLFASGLARPWRIRGLWKPLEKTPAA